MFSVVPCTHEKEKDGQNLQVVKKRGKEEFFSIFCERSHTKKGKATSTTTSEQTPASENINMELPTSNRNNSPGLLEEKAVGHELARKDDKSCKRR